MKFSTAENGKSLLWEISGKDLANPSYFFGTMHLMCAEDAELSDTIRGLIKTVDQVYFEVDLDNASELLSGIIELQENKGLSLSNVLPKEEYNKLKSFFEKYQPSIPFSILEKQPPLMISSSIYELLLPCDNKNGIEMKIIDETYKEKKLTKGLETVAFQASIFDSIPYAEQAKDLVKTIDSLESNRVAMQRMLTAYKDQDVEKLYALGVNDEGIAGSYIDLLLFKRNRNWVEQFPMIARNGSTLFAVGAAHLGGENGVLDLLKKQGYTIRPLVN